MSQNYDLPHGAVFDEEQQKIYIDVDNVTIAFTVEEFLNFSAQISDIQLFITFYSQVIEKYCPDCLQGTQEIVFEGHDDKDLS